MQRCLQLYAELFTSNWKLEKKGFSVLSDRVPLWSGVKFCLDAAH